MLQRAQMRMCICSLCERKNSLWTAVWQATPCVCKSPWEYKSAFSLNLKRACSVSEFVRILKNSSLGMFCCFFFCTENGIHIGTKSSWGWKDLWKPSGHWDVCTRGEVVERRSLLMAVPTSEGVAAAEPAVSTEGWLRVHLFCPYPRFSRVVCSRAWSFEALHLIQRVHAKREWNTGFKGQ